ncbi:hypothetical protein CHH55_05015 [Niallia circulans]|uniref:hypothetical protein n=1 Tax=Niallia circulans TaxID=1397 RepID=UPI000BA5809D|nr:hypothetical protein [Niallia circulans]MCM2982482.1 hypothetical protein [Niallia circulans]PAD89020.1 hypothetical protein CHH55_05015 [Niallia circulans]PAE10468.1 hypothetical protein CHI02_20040 [Niallia circulans]
MKGLALFLMLFYFLVTGLWIANSPYLFSVQGMIVWLISIVPGFVMYKQIYRNKHYKETYAVLHLLYGVIAYNNRFDTLGCQFYALG